MIATLRRGVLATIILALGLGASGHGPAAETLPTFNNVELAQTSVSGLSSGAYMAGQFHVAFSDSLVGAGLVAGGPYNCAQGSLATALTRCMNTTLGAQDPAHLFRDAQGFAERKLIDPLSNLADDRIYVFSGTNDSTVDPDVGTQTVAFYEMAGLPTSSLAHVTHIGSGHAFVTEDFGSDCAITASPFISDCDYDQAGEILRHIYGTLTPPATSPGGRLVEFEQGQLIAQPTSHSMNDTGFVYVPQDCEAGQSCRVHIVFHGCKQTTEDIGDLFYTKTGFNRWADTNKLIILYPQALAGTGNPNGCWDWWGYDRADYAVRTGPQMAAVKAMLDRLAGAAPPPGDYCQVFDTSNYSHWQAGRAGMCGFWSLCATGSGDLLGTWFGSTELYEHPEGNFTRTPCDS